MDSPDGMLEPKHHALLNESARRRLPSADGVRLCFQLLATASAIGDCAARLARARRQAAGHGCPLGAPCRGAPRRATGLRAARQVRVAVPVARPVRRPVAA